jgi:hypothetical protein
MRQIRGVDPDHCQISLRISADKSRRVNACITQGHFDFAGALHDVTVRQDEPIARKNETGPAASPAFTAQNADVHDARGDSTSDRCDRPRIGIEKLVFIDRGERRSDVIAEARVTYQQVGLTS